MTIMPEQQNIEYKSSWHDDYLKWICGFATRKEDKFIPNNFDAQNIVYKFVG